jgi:CheY-like chemotaxis protein
VEFARGTDRVEALTEDVSRRGAYLRTDLFLPRGEVTEVTVTLPGGGHLKLPMRIAHILPEGMARSLGRSGGMGLEIVGEPPVRWTTFVESLHAVRATDVPIVLGAVSVLVIDQSTPLLERLLTNLAAAGFAVRTAKSLDAGLTLVGGEAPDVILADLATQGPDPAALARLVATDVRLAKTSIMLMSEENSDIARLSAYRNGVRDYITKPFTDEEIVIRLRRLTPVVDDEGNEARRVPALRGNLEDIGVGMLLSLLEYERKSGVLVLLRESEAARLHLADGAVRRVDLQGEGEAMVKLNAVLGWKSGTFEFTIEPVDVPDEIGLPTSHLLLEHARVNDEGGTANDGGEGLELDFGDEPSDGGTRVA